MTDTSRHEAAARPAQEGSCRRARVGLESQLIGVIAEAEKIVNSKPNDEQAKKTLAQAYFDRAFALTQPPARQYAAALGDYRRALKHDSNHEESKMWIDQISTIFRSLGKEPPKEGEEPAPLPFKK